MIPQKHVILVHLTTIVWRHGVPFMRVTLLIVDVIIGAVHRTRQLLHPQLHLHLHLKANQVNLGILKKKVVKIIILQNVRQAVRTDGLEMVYVMIRV